MITLASWAIDRRADAAMIWPRVTTRRMDASRAVAAAVGQRHHHRGDPMSGQTWESAACARSLP